MQNIHYEMEDLLEQANEIQESLGRSYAVPDELDEADLEAGTCLIVDSQDPNLPLSELDALQLEVEEEGPSYLSDLNKVPDFVDEPPVEVAEVSSPRLLQNFCLPPSRVQQRKQSRQAHDDNKGYPYIRCNNMMYILSKMTSRRCECAFYDGWLNAVNRIKRATPTMTLIIAVACDRHCHSSAPNKQCCQLRSNIWPL